MKKTALLLLISFCASLASAQQSVLQWNVDPVAPTGKPFGKPVAYRNVAVSEQSLLTTLAAVSKDAAQPTILSLPQPDGSLRTFKSWQTPLMEPDLAQKHPEIITITATAYDNHRVTAKLDYTPFGLHVMVTDGSRTFFIDPFGKTADGRYISYYRKDSRGAAGTCAVTSEGAGPNSGEPLSLPQTALPNMHFRMNGSVRRTYRLALACTGEYALAVAGPSPTKSAVLAKMITTINRVNSVYERDLAITMQLIGNEDTLIFLDPINDPYSDANAFAMLGQNQFTIDSRIKKPNYDIGHVFATGGGGGAGTGLGVAFDGVCNDTFKAQGVTGRPNPTGDAFDIDFVAHEIGHQFGAEHSFNNNSAGACNANAFEASAFEPGSGSTIMAYAGICGSEDLQPNTDPYFHSASLEQITTYIAENTCAVLSPTPNINATLLPYSATYNIPSLTAFELTAPAAADATADTLTYCWEQRDLGDFGKSLSQTRLRGPLFRSFRPTTDRTRIFPAIDSLLKSVFIYSQEKIPDTSRTLTFRVTERDVYQGFGAFNFPDDSITLRVTHTGAPFRVTSPDANSAWAGGTTQTVLWNIAGTNAAPINCTAVNIFLSTDGGYTFPDLLVANTPNDGAETILLPNVNTTNLRIKVKAAGNVFFAISHTTPPTGIDRPRMNNGGVMLSPVPATNELTVSFIKPREAALAKIVNAVGQLMWMGTIIERASINVSGWAKGIYYIKLSNDSTVNVARPFVVN